MIPTNHSAYLTTTTGRFYPPNPMEDLSGGIKYAANYIANLVSSGYGHTSNLLVLLSDWIYDAQHLLSLVAAPAPVPQGPPPTMPNCPGFISVPAHLLPSSNSMHGLAQWIPDMKEPSVWKDPRNFGKPSVLPPQICTKCKFKNDYAGHEHLQPNGTYICRGCK